MAGLNVNKVLDLAIVGAIGLVAVKVIDKLGPSKSDGESSPSEGDGWLSGDEKGVLEKIGEFFLGKRVSAQEQFNKTQDTSSSPFLPGYKPSSDPTATIYDKGFIDAVMSDLPAALSGTVNSIYWTLTQQHLDWTHEELASQALKDAGIPLNLYTGNTGQIGGSTYIETSVTLPIAAPGYTESYVSTPTINPNQSTIDYLNKELARINTFWSAEVKNPYYSADSIADSYALWRADVANIQGQLSKLM